MSLLISRGRGESVFIGEALMTVYGVKQSQVKLGFQAPKDVRILRAEVVDAGPNLLPPEERFHNSMIRRIRSMSPERRERLLTYLVQEFCSPKATVGT
jgi:carbon storage regulator CsrA